MSNQSIPPAWSERGYVPPERVQGKDDEDEKGEGAYMRCFHESSKIGRVPNASYFVNSPTARAYIEKRDKELFPVKELSGKPIPNPDMPAWLNRKEGLKTHHSTTMESAIPTGSVQSSPPPKTTTMPSSPENHLQTQQLPPVPPPGAGDQLIIPWSIEPRTGASGPPSTIRWY